MTIPREVRRDVSSPSPIPETAYLPESDGKPMAETVRPREELARLRARQG